MATGFERKLWKLNKKNAFIILNFKTSDLKDRDCCLETFQTNQHHVKTINSVFKRFFPSFVTHSSEKKDLSDIYRQCSSRSACTSAKSNLTATLSTRVNNTIFYRKMDSVTLGSVYMDTQIDLDIHCPHLYDMI